MSNSSEKLLLALSSIGKNEVARTKMVDFLRDIEPLFVHEGFEVRENITGPVVDAIFSDIGPIQKRIENGLVFEFLYRSKISRDFLMSAMPVPDHVWEPQTSKLLLYLAENAKNVFFGGAYFGDQAIPVAKKIAPIGGICHCFEPNSEESSLLSRNAEINGLGNIRVNQLGLWSVPDVTMELVGIDSHAYPNPLAPGSETDSPTFDTTTLEVYCDKLGIQEINLIMLDIEGGEFEVLKGAEKFLKQDVEEAPHLVFEVHSSYMDWSNGLENTELIKYLSGLGYTVFAVRDYQSNVSMSDHPVELIPCDKAYLEGPPHGFNMLAMKDLERLENPFFRFRQNVSPKLLAHRDPKLHHPIIE